MAVVANIYDWFVRSTSTAFEKRPFSCPENCALEFQSRVQTVLEDLNWIWYEVLYVGQLFWNSNLTISSSPKPWVASITKKSQHLCAEGDDEDQKRQRRYHNEFNSTIHDWWHWYTLLLACYKISGRWIRWWNTKTLGRQANGRREHHTSDRERPKMERYYLDSRWCE